MTKSRPVEPRSANPPTRTASSFALAGPSRALDPRTHAYRKDLADAALAGEVIASHYVEPAQRHIIAATRLHCAPDETSEVVAELASGEPMALLECAGGWAWGYAGPLRLVGYVPAKMVG